jgi:GTP-binding protein
MFIDRVVVRVDAGTGGSGASSFRREKFVPMGGPDGGDGGRGGDVLVRADPNLNTLLDFTYRDHWKAERGDHGSGSNRSGRSGDSVVLPVPPGTIIRDAETGAMLGEVLEEGETITVARGGRGGRGNAKFASATTRPPRVGAGRRGRVARVGAGTQAHRGRRARGPAERGQEHAALRDLRARPKIADYPFTTLSPNLGVVPLPGHRTFVVADIPGIIEGASEGKGLGLQFLRHIERTRVLAFVIPIDAMDYQAGVRPAAARGARVLPELADKPTASVLHQA